MCLRSMLKHVARASSFKCRSKRGNSQVLTLNFCTRRPASRAQVQALGDSKCRALPSRDQPDNSTTLGTSGSDRPRFMCYVRRIAGSPWLAMGLLLLACVALYASDASIHDALFVEDPKTWLKEDRRLRSEVFWLKAPLARGEEVGTTVGAAAERSPTPAPGLDASGLNTND